MRGGGDVVESGQASGEELTGEMVAGEMTAEEMTAGEMTAGEMTAGEMTAGEMTAGEMTAGEMTAGEMTAGEMVAGEMAAGDTVAGETAAGEMMPEPEPTSEHAFLIAIPGDIPDWRDLAYLATIPASASLNHGRAVVIALQEPLLSPLCLSIPQPFFTPTYNGHWSA